MKNKIKLIISTSFLFSLSLLFLASCGKGENKTVDNKDIIEPITTNFPDEDKNQNDILVDTNEDDNPNYKIVSSETTYYGALHNINNDTNDVVGNSYTQISYSSESELNLRYIFEVKTLNCDISLSYSIYKPDKTTVYMAEQTQEVKTVYKSYYADNNLVTADDNTWFVIYTMRGIPTKYWDYFINVNCNVYQMSAEKIEANKIGNVLAKKNALTILNLEDSSYLDSEFTFNYNNGEYQLTGYNGSDTELVIPEKRLYTVNDESIYLNVTSIESNALPLATKVLLPKTINTIKANAVSSSCVLCYDDTSVAGITNNTSNVIYPFSDTYQANAWHYKNDIIRLWKDSINVTNVAGANETATVTFNVSANSTKDDYNVYYSTDRNTFTKIDNDLIIINGSTATAYIVGLAPGSYYVKVELADDHTEYKVSNMIQVSQQDRSGYAHFNYTDGVGAYNDDGTLKDNTVVVYVTDSNKNTVQATFGGTTYTGLGNILKNLSKSSNPVCIRFLDRIETTQFNTVTYTSTKQTAELNTEILTSLGNYDFANNSNKIYAETILANGYNSYSNDLANGITTLENINNSFIKYDTKKSEYDSCWNDMKIDSASNVTIEGIGENAGIFQWGMTFARCNYIEIKNLTFTDCPEDCCSFQGTNNDDMEDYHNYWVHNCTFNLGSNNWDVSYEQDKHEGDGSTDFKYCHNVTISYCRYNNTHKTGLVGSGSSDKQYNITFHHNYYYECEARLPYARQANMHMYNNYYYTSGTTKTHDEVSWIYNKSILQIYANAYAFIEKCYFDGYKNPIKFDTTGTPAVKIYNTTFVGEADNATHKNYIVSNRTDTITNTCAPTSTSTSYSTFDTNSSLFYYANNKSNVTIMNDTSDVPDFVIAYAGAGVNNYNSLEIGTADEINEFSINMHKTELNGGNYYTKHVKTIYKAGDTLDTSNLTINVDGVYTESLTGCTFSGYSSTAGTHEVTVDYLNLSDTYTVYVLPNSEYYNVAIGSKYSVGGTTTLNNETYITFKTIEQGLEYLREFTNPSANNRATLYISAGYYNEKVEIDIPYLTITGAGTCKATYSSDESYNQNEYKYATIIEYDSLYGVDQAGFKNVTDSTQTLAVRANAKQCIIENLTISNWWNNNARFNSMYDFLKDYTYYDSNNNLKYVASNNKINEHRALAILIQADEFTMRDCSLLGYQDTLELFKGRQYFYNTYISGTTDYIFGSNNSTLFDNCIIHTIYNGNNSAGGYITAFKGCTNGASTAVDYGVTFYKCTIEGDSNSNNVSLGRPWGSYAQVSFIECNMTSCVSTTQYTSGANQGRRYVSMSGINPTDSNVRFYEYGNTGAGSISEAQSGMTLLSSSEASKCYDYEYIFGKTNGAVTYSLGWDPVNGQEVDNNTYYFFNGGTSETGTVYSFTGTLQNQNCTMSLGDLYLDATGSKLAYRNGSGDSQMNAGTKITYTASAGSSLTVEFYDTKYSINGTQATSASTSVYFETQTNVTILATGSTYIHYIVINKADVNPGSVDLTYFFDFNADNSEQVDTSTQKNYKVSDGYSIQNTTGTIGDDFIIDVDARNGGKLADGNNNYSQFNSGTKLTFVAPYDCQVTLVSYAANQASINGVLSTTNTLTQQFTSGTTVTILATGNGYITSLTISPVDSVNTFNITSITATSTITEVQVNGTFDSSTVTVKGFASNNTNYRLLSSSEYSLSSLDTSTTGSKTITVTYNTLNTTINVDVVANVETTITSNYCMEFSKNGVGTFDGDKYTWSDTTKAGTEHKMTISGSGFSNSGYLQFKSPSVITFDIDIPSGKTKAILTINYYYSGNQSTVTVNSGSAITGTEVSTSGENNIYSYNLTESGTVTITASGSTNYLNYISVVFE